MAEIYRRFKELKRESPSNCIFDKMGLVKFDLDGKNYEIYFTKKRANKRTIIYCEDNAVVWEQLPRLAMSWGAVYGKRENIVSLVPSKDRVKIVVIMGKPNIITGLDDGIFRSAHKYNENCINVMSEARFKEL